VIAHGHGVDSRAVFSSYLASRYVYKYGLQAPEIAFYEYMRTEFHIGD
jgi:hypothetical protein